MNEAILFVVFIVLWFLYVSKIIIFKRQEHQVTRPLVATYVVFKNIFTFFSSMHYNMGGAEKLILYHPGFIILLSVEGMLLTSLWQWNFRLKHISKSWVSKRELQLVSHCCMRVNERYILHFSVREDKKMICTHTYQNVNWLSPLALINLSFARNCQIA